MAKIKTEYDLLISCPGDVSMEVELIQEVVKKFNDTYSDVLSIRLNAKHWSTDSYNQSGGKAQELLNNQFIHDCDAAIAIFWTRFGSPTDKYGSGTEEEIENMLATGKQVFLYFSEKPISANILLSQESKSQYQKVKDFKKRYEQDGKGIYSSFSSDEEFKGKLFAHISQHFLSLKKIDEICAQKKSNLIVKGIYDDKLDDEAIIQDFRFAGSQTIDEMISDIKALYSTIDKMEVKEEAQNQFTMAMYKKVELSEDTKKIIISFAKRLNINMTNSFFFLGGLKKDIINSAIIYGGRSIKGEPSEKKKYNLLMELKQKILTLDAWTPFEKSFGSLKCIKLAVKNNGTTYDEDIDVVLKMKSILFVMPEQLPKVEEYSYESIIKDYSMGELFGIVCTSSYNDYESSKKSFLPINTYAPIPALPLGLMEAARNYEQEYYDDLKNTFDYDFFQENEDIIIKLHIDYLKHNTAVAFPTVLFVANELSYIEYTIQSKYNDAVVNGTIRVGEPDET